MDNAKTPKTHATAMIAEAAMHWLDICLTGETKSERAEDARNRLRDWCSRDAIRMQRPFEDVQSESLCTIAGVKPEECTWLSGDIEHITSARHRHLLLLTLEVMETPIGKLDMREVFLKFVHIQE